MENITTIDIPKFQVAFEDNKKYRYTAGKGRENLKNVLYKASHNYCMYCYTRIKIDGRGEGKLEHAIEKSISPEILTECIPNIGIACGTCNEKYKRVGEKLRVPAKESVAAFEKKAACKHTCRNVCKSYMELKQEYLREEHAHIILQPQGVVGKESGFELLQYDALETKFIPSRKYQYTRDEKCFIQDHINRFHLNARNEKTKQLIYFIEDTIEKDGLYTKVEPNNLIVELFVEQILVGRTREEVLKICKMIYRYSFIKFAT